jgi:hypothetical protein
MLEARDAHPRLGGRAVVQRARLLEASERLERLGLHLATLLAFRRGRW